MWPGGAVNVGTRVNKDQQGYSSDRSPETAGETNPAASPSASQTAKRGSLTATALPGVPTVHNVRREAMYGEGGTTRVCGLRTSV